MTQQVQEPDFLQSPTPSTDAEKKNPLTPGTIFLLVALVLFISILALQLFRQKQTQPVAGDRAPQFEVTAYDGEVYNLEELRGQIVILNVWANWCPPCHQEAPDFQAIHEDYQDSGVVVLGVNWLDIDSEAFEFIDRYDITYPNAPDLGERVYETYNVEGLPETWVIDPDGVVRAFYIGGTNYDALASVLDELLAESGS